MEPRNPRFFATREGFRKWLEKNHKTADEIFVAFWKKGTGKPSITWPEAIEEAIAFGWIDSVRHSLDAESYTNRFTPRKPTSNWSLINVATARRLISEGRMAPAGRAAFIHRSPEKTGTYSFEQARDPRFAPEELRRLKASGKAWKWFSAKAPHYRKAATLWVISAKRPETRERRLASLIKCSATGVHVPPLRPRAGKARAGKPPG